jgi:hypothetical protein
MQTLEPAAAAYLPASQLVQTDDAAAEYVPAVQLVQTVEAVPAAYLPASQSSQAPAPAAAENLPTRVFLLVVTVASET